MKVLILTTQYLPHIGGSELAIQNLTSRIPEVQFDIVSSGFGGKWLMPLTGLLRGLRHRYDVIHVFQASYAGGAGVLLKFFRPRIPLIVTLQEGKDLDKQNVFVRFCRKLIIRRADVVTAISSHLLSYAKTVNPKATCVLLPNGVAMEMFSHSSSEYIFTSSRLVEKNGIDTLIRAMVFLPGEHLKIVGKGSQRAQLDDLVRELKLTDRVHFIGAVAHHDLPAYLSRASVFVRPSRSEGLGNAFLEAMAAGVPVVGTPVGGIPDFLTDRETGMLCTPDDPRSVADAVQTVLTDQQLRDHITRRALQLVRDRYDWNQLAKQYHEIIRRHSRL